MGFIYLSGDCFECSLFRRNTGYMRTLIRSSLDKVQCAVVGAGVIGLACAKRLSECGFETVVLESSNVVGSGELLQVMSDLM